MFIDEIKKIAKTQKIDLFFDMDGVLVEYINDPNKERYNLGTNFYTYGRPVLTMIKLAKRFSRIPNVTVHILSNCPLEEQIEQKTNWLKIHAPFFKKENIHIICYEKLVFEKEEKPFLKPKFLKDNFGDKTVFLIEDDLRNIKSTNTFYKERIAYHISSLLK